MSGVDKALIFLWFGHVGCMQVEYTLAVVLSLGNQQMDQTFMLLLGILGGGRVPSSWWKRQGSAFSHVCPWQSLLRVCIKVISIQILSPDL
jgi:hypothetical protein